MKKADPLFAEVALAIPMNKSLDYQVPPTLKEVIEVGIRVLVPLEKRKVTGYILKLKTSSDIENTKYIEEILEPFPLFNPTDLNFYKWIASYYFCPLGYVIKNALPPGINVKTLKHLSLTSKGKKALNDKTLSQPEKNLLSILAEKRKITLKSLRKSFKYERVFALISSPLHKEYVTMTQCKSFLEIKPQKEKVFQVNEDALSRLSLSELKRVKRKSPRQFHILKWLRKQGKATQKEIFSHLGKVGPTLKALEIKNLINISIQEKYRSPLINYEENIPSEPPEMTSEQANALKEITSKVKEGKYASFLLHGITGSGKTEVYLKAIEATLKTGRGAIVLVPEIALTPQLITRFKARFGNKIAQIHSGLSKGERFDEWRRIKYGEVQIVIGARSAIFAPLKSLGIIIVDEEHDSAYKQDERICYNARDLALVKGKMNNAVVVLGSATPTIETYHNTRIGKISYLSLSRRIDNRPLPRVEILDMRNEKPGTILSARLRNALEERWERGEQTLLFLNRRGFSPFVLCQECGYSFRCPNCNVSLVFHQNKRLLICHYCNFYKPKTDTCPECGSNKVKNFGFGTERLETEIHRYFPQLKVGRLDKDTTVKKNSLQRILGEFRKGETDLLIGTQMIAMGHDLPQVTLVGVIAADISLNFPDFRSGERTFQLLTQVAGRSGRGQIPGEVIIQTYNPNHPSIRMAMAQDFLPFYEEEILYRKELKYPPFQRLVNFRMVGNSLSKTRDYASSLGKLSIELQKKERSFQNNIEILGPVEAPWEKLKGKYRWQMLVKGKDHRILHQFAEKVIALIKPQIKISGVKLTVDVDPINLL
jgi:primosomal protein N' (replication factor Y)